MLTILYNIFISISHVIYFLFSFIHLSSYTPNEFNMYLHIYIYVINVLLVHSSTYFSVAISYMTDIFRIWFTYIFHIIVFKMLYLITGEYFTHTLYMWLPNRFTWDIDFIQHQCSLMNKKMIHTRNCSVHTAVNCIISCITSIGLGLWLYSTESDAENINKKRRDLFEKMLNT